ncbi:MAG: hypothetical protein H0V89_14185 [Deltaproteobacteria bacterium]|nr:hypothetical protein [Deltaproteobacteria bacterium]
MTPTREIVELENALEHGGVHEALRWLNARTPHRYTGIYRFDDALLRNVHLFDRSDPDVRVGSDAPMEATFCAMVGRSGEALEIADAARETRFPVLPVTPVISYCGALIRDQHGEPYGTLCHYDMLPCEQRTSDIPLLEAATPLIYARIRSR